MFSTTPSRRPPPSPAHPNSPPPPMRRAPVIPSTPSPSSLHRLEEELRKQSASRRVQMIARQSPSVHEVGVRSVSEEGKGGSLSWNVMERLFRNLRVGGRVPSGEENTNIRLFNQYRSIIDDISEQTLFSEKGEMEGKIERLTLEGLGVPEGWKRSLRGPNSYIRTGGPPEVLRSHPLLPLLRRFFRYNWARRRGMRAPPEPLHVDGEPYVSFEGDGRSFIDSMRRRNVEEERNSSRENAVDEDMDEMSSESASHQRTRSAVERMSDISLSLREREVAIRRQQQLAEQTMAEKERKKKEEEERGEMIRKAEERRHLEEQREREEREKEMAESVKASTLLRERVREDGNGGTPRVDRERERLRLESIHIHEQRKMEVVEGAHEEVEEKKRNDEEDSPFVFNPDRQFFHSEMMKYDSPPAAAVSPLRPPHSATLRPEEVPGGRLRGPMRIPDFPPEIRCRLDFDEPNWDSLDPMQTIPKPSRYNRLPDIDVSKISPFLFKDIPTL